ncbi:hypothetical protein ACIRYZ_06220 [Kitasatospora sp. NPDC101155]|uniref:hypothetical protein n=1 Tax=Kitasatospora sp. NPDC101155 TaxID=3364097 RepID=UPI003811C46C
MDAQPADSADLLGDLLADRGVPHAVIDLDRFCQAWPAPEDDPFQHRLLPVNLRAVADNYRAAGLHRLVPAGVAENAAERAAYQDALGMPLRVCRLTAALPTVRARLRTRHEADHGTDSLTGACGGPRNSTSSWRRPASPTSRSTPPT